MHDAIVRKAFVTEHHLVAVQQLGRGVVRNQFAILIGKLLSCDCVRFETLL